jgi:predicted ATPase
LTSFIGREKELKEITRLFTSSRLLTLTGSGGVGKTRLAIEAASLLLPRFEDGVWWVDLVGLADPFLVPQEVAKVLGVPEVPNQTTIDMLVKQLSTKHILIVLDNCEHLISACAQLTDRLLGSCKNLKMLTTSREVLDVPGETTLPVPSLSLPAMQESFAVKTLSKFESVRLFSERATLVHPVFELNDQNAKAVVQICHRLGGIPLAIELAATRVKLMHVDEIAKRLNDRFDLLTSGNRSVLPRHQTLRATFDWSYDLLTESERILFRRLSVFAGGFTLEAVEAVCSKGINKSDILDLFGRLADKSLVIIDVTSSNDESRYRILETIREYAYEKLVEAREEDAIRDRHLEFLLNLVEQVEPELEHIQQQIWLDRLELEIDNIRLGLEWALENQEITTALRMVSALRRFWFIRAHHNEGVERLRAILSRPDAKQPTPARLKALNTYLFMLWPVGQSMEAEPQIQATEGMTLAEEVLALGAHLGDRWNTAFAQLFIGVGAMARGDYPLARSYLEKSLEIWLELQDRTYLPWSLVYLGDLAMFESDFANAQTLFEQAIPLLRQANDYPILAIPLRRLGQLAMYNGNRTKAAQLIEESLLHNWNIRDYRGVGASLAALGDFCMMQTDTKRAAEIFGVVDTLLEFIHTSFLPFDQQQYERNVGRLRAQLDQKTFTKFWAKGKALSIEKAVALALEEA